MEKIKVLLVEDEPTLAMIIKDTLDGNEFDITLAANGEEGLSRYAEMKPDIMLFDEPTSALDPEMIGEVLEVMIDLAKQGMTMVVVSHEMSFIREVADKVLVLADGVIIEEGSPQEVFTNPRHERCRSFLSKIL